MIPHATPNTKTPPFHASHATAGSDRDTVTMWLYNRLMEAYKRREKRLIALFSMGLIPSVSTVTEEQERAFSDRPIWIQPDPSIPGSMSEAL